MGHEVRTMMMHQAVVYAMDCGGSHPHHGAWLHEGAGVWYPIQWANDGECNMPKRPDLNLRPDNIPWERV